MKPVKAIDLVWKAQPMISTLRTVMESISTNQGGKGSASTLVQHCDEWLDAARTLLRKKGEQ